MQTFWHFLQYHNAVPIALGIVVLGGGVTFAATNPETIYSTTQQVIAIDNTYLANKDLETWTPQIRINGVTEDDERYHVAYSLTTIDLEGYAWKDLTKSETMSVSKADLGEYRDLGVYVTQQLRQIIDRELQRLRETQAIERQNVSLATIATVYGGLVGALLTDSTETLPGYTPVVTAPSEVIAGSFSEPSAGGSSGAGGAGAGASGGSSAQIGLQILGNNPARIPPKTAYADLGVALIDPLNINVGVYTFVDGREVLTPSLDTSTSTSYTIEYRATDRNGVKIMVRRIVIVGDAADPGGAINEAGNVAPVPPSQDESAPAAPEAATSTPNESGTTTPTTSATSSTDAQVGTTTESASTTPEVPAAEEPVVEEPAAEEPVATSSQPEAEATGQGGETGGTGDEQTASSTPPAL